MKRQLSNVVINCDSARESDILEQILQEKDMQYEVYCDAVEIYESRSTQEWDELFTEIENRLNG